ncbi:hypothetical protein [Vampirovibrio sp.]|uniref:hypothetical protein n=1 Tax=Vampirovibrio sp. TaxID=2717857 RepID=UPI0035935B49
MKPLSIGFSRFLARSLSIAVIGSLLASWTPLGISMAQDASEESPALDASLERLWNQSLDDPSPQVRGVPGAPPAQRVNPPKAQPSPPKPAALPVSQPTSKAASQEKPIQNAIPNSASPKPKKDTLETPPERSGVALPLAMPLAPLNESKVQPKFGKNAKPRS